VAPVWVAREGDHILLGITEDSVKGKNSRRDPRIALSVLDFGDPYRHAQLRGRVVGRRPDPHLTGKDAMSMKYLGQPFPRRVGEGRVILVIEVDRARYARIPFRHAPA
jgi:PPOX class probable F420-dependent enzyme